MELIADFQQFYGLQLEGMWSGDISPARVLTRISGLHTEHGSRFRASWLREHPPSSVGDSAPSWKDWTPEVSMLASLVNLKVTELKGKKPKSAELVKTPMDQAQKKKYGTVADFARDFNRG